MDSPQIQSMSQYPRPWFYRPEIYYGLFIFPPVWSILTLRSPWHNRREGFFGILIGGIAWFLMIASVVLSVRWVQEGGVINLFVFVPGLLLTLVTQIQWTAHRARYGPPPGEQAEEQAREQTEGPGKSPQASSATATEEPESDTLAGDAPPPEGRRRGRTYTPRRRPRRRRRPGAPPPDADSLH